MTRPDYRDMVITDIADELAARNAELMDALRDRETYRLGLKLAIHQLARLTTENKRLRDRMAEMRDSSRDVEREAA